MYIKRNNVQIALLTPLTNLKAAYFLYFANVSKIDLFARNEVFTLYTWKYKN